MRIGAPVRNGFLARAAWRQVVSHTATAPSSHIPSHMWTLHFAAPANYSIHFSLMCGGCCCSGIDNMLRLAESQISTLQWYNLQRYIGTSPMTDREPNQSQRTNQHNSLQVSLTQPATRFSRNGSAHERLLRRYGDGKKQERFCTACRCMYFRSPCIPASVCRPIIVDTCTCIHASWRPQPPDLGG